MKIVRAAGLLLALALLWLSVPVRAADRNPAPLPEGLMLHVAVNSLGEFLRSTDDVVVAVTRGSAYRMAAGMIPMMAQMYMPFPEEAWNADGEVHFLMPSPDADIMGSWEDNHAFVITAQSFDHFIRILEEDGIHTDADDDVKARIVEVKGLGNYYAIDAGDGLIVLSLSEEMLDIVRSGLSKGWKPRHWGSGALNVDFIPPKGWREQSGLSDLLADEFDNMRNKLEEDESPMWDGVVNREVVLNALDAFKKVLLPKMEAEMDQVRGLSFDLTLGKDRVGLATRVSSEPGSLVASLGTAAAAGANKDYHVADFVDAGAATLVVNAPLETILPDASQRISALFAEIVGTIFPDQKDGLTNIQSSLMSTASGENATASFVKNGATYNAAWVKTADPDAAIGAYADLFGEVNKMVKTALPGAADHSFQFDVADAKAADGTTYLTVKFTPANPEKFQELVDQISEKDPSARVNLEQLQKLRILITAHADATGSYLVVVSGAAEEAELIAALDAAAKGVSKKMIDSPAAKAALVALPFRQDSYSLIGVHQFFVMILDSLAQSAPGDQQENRKIADEVAPKFRDGDDVVGFGMGGVDGRLVLEFTTTPQAINAMRHNGELLFDAIKRIEPSLASDDDEDYEGEDGQYDEEEEPEEAPEEAPAQ